MIKTISYSAGFTLIEIVIFIVVTAILMQVILFSADTALVKSPTLHNNLVAAETAQRCMEFYLQAIRNNGNSPYIPCGQNISASQCYAPSGYSVSSYVGCASWGSNDTDYETLTVTVTGTGNAVLSVQYPTFLS